MVFIHIHDRKRSTLIYGDSQDGSVFFMNVNSGKLIKNHVRSNHLQYGLTVLAALDSKSPVYLSGFEDGKILQFNYTELQGQLKINNKKSALVSAISSDGKTLCLSNGSIVLSDTDDIVHSLPMCCISCACFIKKRNLLITGHNDGQVILWKYTKSTKLWTFSGHFSQAKQFIRIEQSDWIVSYGQDDLHIGMWGFGEDNMSKEISLATEAGAVLHMDSCKDRLAVLTKEQYVVIFSQMNSSDSSIPQITQRIQLFEPAIGVLLIDENRVHIVKGTCNALQICAANKVVSEKKASNFKNKTLEEVLDVLVPLPPTHKVSLSVALNVPAQMSNENKQCKHVTLFIGALKSGDCQLIDSLLIDRSEEEIRDILLPLSKDLQNMLVQHISRRLVGNIDSALQILTWIYHIIDIFDTDVTIHLVHLFDYRCSVFQYFLRLKNLINHIPEEQVIKNCRSRKIDVKKRKIIPVFVDQC